MKLGKSGEAFFVEKQPVNVETEGETAEIPQENVRTFSTQTSHPRKHFPKQNSRTSKINRPKSSSSSHVESDLFTESYFDPSSALSDSEVEVHRFPPSISQSHSQGYLSDPEITETTLSSTDKVKRFED